MAVLDHVNALGVMENNDIQAKFRLKIWGFKDASECQ